MAELSDLRLSDLQPSQFWISERKLADVKKWFRADDLSAFEPLPVKWLDGVPVLTDGHTRAVAALQAGLEKVPLADETDELDWDLYRLCVSACRERGVFSPESLTGRILKEEDYRREWDGWCDELHAKTIRERIVITEQALSDLLTEELIRLSEEWEKEDSCHGYRANGKADIGGNRIFTASDNGKVIGYLFGHTEKTKKTTSVMPEGTSCFELEELYVQPDYRNMGIGRMLFAAAEEAARKEASYLTLSTATKNWKAILHFYIDELGMDFWNARLFKKL